LVVSVANTALVNDGSREWVQVASTSCIRAKSLIAGSNQVFDSGNSKAVDRRELASENGVAGILCASVVVKASDVGVNTSSCWNTGVDSANTVIITVSGVEGNVVTSSGGAAIVVSAGISVIAVNSGVSAETSVNVTSVKGASVATCTIERSWVTMSIGVVAGIDLAVDGGTGNVEASVARNQGVNTSSCGVASVCSARISVITVD